MNDDKTPGVSCPHCGNPLAFDVLSRLTDRSRMKMRLTPTEGQLLSAKTLGATLTELANLLEALGKAHGVDTQVLVEAVTTSTDGIEITVLNTVRQVETEPAHD